MPCSTEFLLYVTVYRLSVLAIGALSIYLGFRLFSRPPGVADSGGNSSSVGVQAGEFKLRVTNFLPGIYFALFGTVLIGIMLWQGQPEMTETIKETQAVKDKPAVRTVSRLVRGSARIDINKEWEKLDRPGISFAEAAEHLSNIARGWKREGKRIGEAAGLARLAVQYGSDASKAVDLALFAELQLANGETEEALEAMKAAAERDSVFRDALSAMLANIERVKGQ